jgi:serine/threonine protein kinase
MNQSRWQRVEELFHAALEREPSARDAFLTEACNGDSELRREIESLIAAAEPKFEFLDRPAMEVEAKAMSREHSGTLSGRRFAHYVIGPLLGVGGMAEVYRARDMRLDRDVAIKVLPGYSSLDAVRFGRFRREAKLLASVTHPNVAAVYGFEQVDNLCAVVMELIEGETLSDRIVRQRPTLDDVLEIAAQIAAAVEAAHAKEIIHRDLKPSNIRLTTDGTVKVLDFGIAKMLEPEGNTEVRRVTGPTTFSTEAAVIVGTVAYMSPEQARGQKVGRPTDVWAFGCVLFEMLAGSRPFEGTVWTDMIARIASEDPDWAKLPATTPASIRLLLEDCLQKDSARRLQDIGEARRRIDNTQTRSAASITTAPTNEYALSVRSARFLFLLIQVGFLAMYTAALSYQESLEQPISQIVLITAMTGIAIRLFLISSVALSHREAGRKFSRLFPVLLVFDAAWAVSPLLAVPPLARGVALAGVAGLAYLPFTQRTLMQRIYGK